MEMRKLSVMGFSGIVFLASLLAVSHVHLPQAGFEAQSSDVANLNCGCVSHNSNSAPAGEPAPSNQNDCHLCKLLTQLSGATIVLNPLTIELDRQHVLEKLETLKPAGIEREYQVRGPPAVQG